jgi:hypothetical protein
MGVAQLTTINPALILVRILVDCVAVALFAVAYVQVAKA